MPHKPLLQFIKSLSPFFPLPVILTFEQNLAGLHFGEASLQLLIREERLFGETITGGLSDRGEEINKLASDYRALKRDVEQTLQKSLCVSLEEFSHEALASAVKAVLQEDKQDQKWKQSGRTAPDWRPGGWSEMHDSTLRGLVKERMDNPSTPLGSPTDVTESSVKADIHGMGVQLKHDLLWVVQVVKTCYPPHMHICSFYAEMFHQTFSSRLRKIADFGLGDQDCKFLLLWVNKEYPE